MTDEPKPGEVVDYIWCMDALEFLRALPGESVDLILSDLPYGAHEASWDSVIPILPMWAEFRRLIRSTAAIVLTAVQPFTTQLIAANMEQFKYSLVWEKSLAGDFFNAKHKPLRLHEDILVFSPGTVANGSERRMKYFPQGVTQGTFKHSRPYSAKFRRDAEQIIRTRASWQTQYISKVANYPTSILKFPHGNNDTSHPNQKPLALFEYLIRTYTQPDDVVLDPCVGSGTTAVAARNTGRHFICCDISQDYVNIARDRLRMPFEPRQHVPETRYDDLPLFQGIERAGD